MTGSKIGFLIFMIACAVIFAVLGFWQVKRLQWKENLIAQLEQEYKKDAEQFPVTANDIADMKAGDLKRGKFSGTFQFDKSFKLSGQIDHEKSSQHMIVPLRIENMAVLVDFGSDFILPPGRSQDAAITGLIKFFPEPNKFTPKNNPELEIWYSLNTQDVGRVYEIENLKPFVIKPEATPWGSFNLEKTQPRNSHLQYACFWFAMSAMTLVMTGMYLRAPSIFPGKHRQV